MAPNESLSIKCKHCGKDTLFEQPYPYHAGFTDQGFLYNDADILTLVWSILDPTLDKLFPGQPTWALSLLDRRRFEKRLLPAPDGGHWRFHNPARCIHCAKPISKPMLRSTHYLVYPGSLITDQGGQFKLVEYMKATP